MAITIDKMQPSDLDDVMRLLREFAEYENLAEYCTATSEHFFDALFGEDAVADGLMAHDGNRAAGYAIFYPNFSTFCGERGLYLEDIYISPGFRRGGTGELMLREIARFAAERGFRRIDFQVLDWNILAIKFYEKHGAESNTDESHYRFSGEAFRRLAGKYD